ncbi:3824_t:CDS:10 [Entrophospora sp. SA101]|nr:3824_t:CDS:10 [Entrophospora sp. SA101]
MDYNNNPKSQDSLATPSSPTETSLSPTNNNNDSSSSSDNALKAATLFPLAIIAISIVFITLVIIIIHIILSYRNNKRKKSNENNTRETNHINIVREPTMNQNNDDIQVITDYQGNSVYDIVANYGNYSDNGSSSSGSEQPLTNNNDQTRNVVNQQYDENNYQTANVNYQMRNYNENQIVNYQPTSDVIGQPSKYHRKIDNNSVGNNALKKPTGSTILSCPQGFSQTHHYFSTTAQVYNKTGEVAKSSLSKIKGIGKSIIYNALVTKELAKEVYIREGLQPPTGAQISETWNNLKSTRPKDFTNLSPTDLVKVGIRTLEVFGIFAIDNTPNFSILAFKDPSFYPYVHYTGKGKPYIDFKNPEAVRQLTYCLLHNDFNLKLDIPLDTLCPPIPNRLNYIHWIEDLISSIEAKNDIVYGIDIGTGASCIYPLLGCTLNKNWKFIATDIDERAIKYAEDNVKRNNLLDRITIVHNKTDNKKILNLLSNDNNNIKQFFIFWYTSMIGRLETVNKIVQELKKNQIDNYVITEFCQGQTRRWGIGWSFGSHRPTMVAPPKSEFCVILSSKSSTTSIKEFLKKLFDELEINGQWNFNDHYNDKSYYYNGLVFSNTWSRSARRRKKSTIINCQMEETEGGEIANSIENQQQQGFLFKYICSIENFNLDNSDDGDYSINSSGGGVKIMFSWVNGQDRNIFESFYNHCIY